MSRYLQKFFAFIMLLNNVKAGIWFGTCPSYTKMASVDFDRYAGFWYEIQRDWQNWAELMASCVIALYTTRTDGDYDVHNR